MVEEPFNAISFLREVDNYRPRRRLKFNSERSLQPLATSIDSLHMEIEKLKIIKTMAQNKWRHKSNLASTVTRYGQRHNVSTTESM